MSPHRLSKLVEKMNEIGLDSSDEESKGENDDAVGDLDTDKVTAIAVNMNFFRQKSQQ
jgi:hypothetical protein